MKKVESEWIFANPQTGNPYWPDKIREDHLTPAGIAAGIGRVGSHTFRHIYSCLLREHEVDLKVQQALMRHADIRRNADGAALSFSISILLFRRPRGPYA
jgi:integrase